MNNKDSELCDRLNRVLPDLLINPENFTEPTMVAAVLDENRELRNLVEKRKNRILYRLGICDKKLKKNISEFVTKYDNAMIKTHECNASLASFKSCTFRNIINPIEGYDLDEQQLSSIFMDVKNRLVIAGAGTGKTTTIVGLVKYLLLFKKINPKDILLLSFTNASVNDLKKRVKAEVGHDVDVYTFHKIGINIIKSFNKKFPSILNEEGTSDFVKKWLSEKECLCTDYMKTYCESYEDRFREGTDLEYKSDFERYIEKNHLYTLKFEKVKSHGEAEIANFLTQHGVKYTYEEEYCKDTRNEKRGQYRPDFHIDGKDVYIEYFGIDRNGNVAEFMSDEDPEASRKYNEEIEWKKKCHKENGTTLIDLYYYNKLEGKLIEILDDRLKKLGIEYDHSSAILEKKIDRMDRMLSDLSSFFTLIIKLIKGFGRPWEEVYPRGKRLLGIILKETERVIKPIYEDYQKHLKNKDMIDFTDMLTTATSAIKDGRCTHHFKYIIVDEYQDISRSSYSLLKAIRDSNDCKLFCVGDDWQSIYRFAGSDVSYILDFEKYWGASEVCKIENTYRFSGELLHRSSNFIYNNPAQIKKKLNGCAKYDSRVTIIAENNKYMMYQKIIESIKKIPVNETVFFIGRFQHDIMDLEDHGFQWTEYPCSKSLKVTFFSRPDLKIEFVTAHKSKGLQADNVFIINNKNGRYGFPPMRNESIIISMLLESKDSRICEERRLYYVAMTRAKKRLFIPYVVGESSMFVDEIVKNMDRNKNF